MEVDEVAAIRARWQGVAWRYEEERHGSFMPEAYFRDASGTWLMNFGAVTPVESELLQKAAQAPGDVQALLTQLDAALHELWEDSAAMVAMQQAIRAYVERPTSALPINKADMQALAALAAFAGDTALPSAATALRKELEALRRVRTVASIAINAWLEASAPAPIDADLSALAVAIRESEETAPGAGENIGVNKKLPKPRGAEEQ